MDGRWADGSRRLSLRQIALADEQDDRLSSMLGDPRAVRHQI